MFPSFLQEFRYFDPNQGIQWVLGHPPEAHPPCGFDGKRCSHEPDPMSIVLITLAVCVVLVAAIFAFRSVLYPENGAKQTTVTHEMFGYTTSVYVD